MSEPRTNRYLTEAEYLKLEEASKQRHEYVDGEIFSMTGASLVHNLICGNIYTRLHTFLDGSCCRPYMNDVKLHVEVARSFYYPDVLVSCEAFDLNSVFVDSAVVIVEVLSPSTKQIDRREKLVAYKKLKKLQYYLIVHQKRMRVEIHKRISAYQWEHIILGRNDELNLQILSDKPFTMSVNAIYAGIDIPLIVEEEPDEEYEFA